MLDLRKKWNIENMIEVINIFREEGLVDEPLNPAALQENYVQNM